MEPKWDRFRIDYVFDNDGTKQRKLEGFMHEFINWREREQLKEPNKPTKKARRKRA